MSAIEVINKNFIELWKRTNFPAESKVYTPMQYKTPKPNSIVFVGMNPSFSLGGFKKILSHTKQPDLDVQKFYKWPITKDFDINFAHEIETYSLKHYAFFEQCRRLAKDLNKDWEHLDLFAYRETDQNKTKLLVIEKGSKFKLNEFGSEQFLLFFKILTLSKPCAIVVANAFASNIYMEQRKSELTFNDNLGYYQETLNGEKLIPIFFSGMLTGGRALDAFSRERLFWQIKKVISS